MTESALPLADRIAQLCSRGNDAGDNDADDGDESLRLYPLRADEGYFDAGVTRDGRQALTAAFYARTIAIFFAGDGTFLEYVERPHEAGRTSPSFVAGRPSSASRRRTIRVKKFTIDDQDLGIDDLTGIDQELLDDPDSEPDEAKRTARLESI